MRAGRDKVRLDPAIKRNVGSVAKKALTASLALAGALLSQSAGARSPRKYNQSRGLDKPPPVRDAHRFTISGPEFTNPRSLPVLATGGGACR
jgi:hypothetical protein